MALKLFDYNSAGKGVSKTAPQKRPFFRFFEVFGRKFWKLIQLNLIFLLFCIPVVTFGPATAAMNHVMRKFILEQPCFVFDEFWNAFKKNFKQSFAIGIFDVLCLVSVGVAFYFFINAQNLTDVYYVYICILIGIATIFYMMHFYIYLEIVALRLSLKAILKNALFLVFLGVKRNFIALVIDVVIVSASVLFLPFSIFFIIFLPFGWIAFTNVFICYPVIQKYIVNPYYEERGEKNPELLSEDENEDEKVFVDRGGTETEIKAAPKKHGKVIK